MEDLVSGTSFDWRGRRVFLTGHTGFKGGWLALWLHRRGANVHGYALDPPTDPALFAVARVGEVLADDTRANLTDFSALSQALTSAEPEVVFHLAAQPLVRQSYREPVTTLTSNVIGTAHVLEAARYAPSVRAIIVITTDKVYASQEWVHPYRESDQLGGADPYSASKAAAEIVTASYRASFFDSDDGYCTRIATARAGNVIGGGDWGDERLIPDCLRALDAGIGIELRYPHAVRPWQHVLEPISGYLSLAERLCGEGGGAFAEAWNFGPDSEGDATAGDVAATIAEIAGAKPPVFAAPTTKRFQETGFLRLDSARARHVLGWRPRWPLRTALARTVAWHTAWRSGGDMMAYSLDEIGQYEKETAA